MQKSVSLLSFNLDVYVELASFLTAKDLVVLASTCSTLFKTLHNSDFWVSFSNIYPKICPLVLANLKIPKDHFYNFFRMSTAAFYSRTSHVQLGMLAIDASSTDFNQNIENVLNDDKTLFWSSKGHDTVDGNEELLFQFKDSFVVPTVLSVRFFKTSWNYGQAGLTYPSQYIQADFSMDGKNWEFSSEKKEVNNDKVEIKVLKNVGVARFVKVNFIGKKTAQQSDNRYYHAVENVKCFGYKVDQKSSQYSQMNELILNGYCSWKEAIAKREENPQKIATEELREELQEYFTKGTFSKKYFTGLEELLKTENFDEIWNYLQENPMLLIQESTFMTIYMTNRPFVKEYLRRINEIKKRDYLYHRETQMAFCDLLQGFALDANAMQSAMALNMLHIDVFKYASFSMNILRAVIKNTGVGNEGALSYLSVRMRNLLNFVNISLIGRP